MKRPRAEEEKYRELEGDITVSAQGGDGTVHVLTEKLREDQTVGYVKQALSVQTEMLAETQSLYVADDKREGIEEKGGELEDGDLLGTVIRYNPECHSTKRLQLLVTTKEVLLWKNCSEERVTISEQGAVATNTKYGRRLPYHFGGELDGRINYSLVRSEYTLVTSDLEMNAGQYYWEVELEGEPHQVSQVRVGVCKPGLDHSLNHATESSTDGWFINGGRPQTVCSFGIASDFQTSSLCNKAFEEEGEKSEEEPIERVQGKQYTLFEARQHADLINKGMLQGGDRVGMLLDLDKGSLDFFKNGVPFGRGYPAGSVTGPVVHALQLDFDHKICGDLGCYQFSPEGGSARLLSNATWPELSPGGSLNLTLR
jgi:hypothetical protein